MSSFDSTPEPVIFLAADAAVELHAADGREVVALAVEEQVVEQVLGGVLGRRLAGTHHAVDLDQRLEARLGRIDAQRVGDVRAAIEIVHVQRATFADAGLRSSWRRTQRQTSLALARISPVSVLTTSCARILP
jgi:hypothetical protein